ncbi:MAG TPA: hypothetical protein ENN03_11880, partial [bacterium]|nr:hypothetical protein [bacterium]
MTASFSRSMRLNNEQHRGTVAMRHRNIRKKLLHYLDGGLTERESETIQNHLQHCVSCREALNRLEVLWGGAETGETVKVPPFLWNRVSARLQQRKRARFSIRVSPAFRPVMRLGFLFLVMGMAVAGGIGLGKMIGSGDSSFQSAIVARQGLGLENLEAVPPGSL